MLYLLYILMTKFIFQIHKLIVTLELYILMTKFIFQIHKLIVTHETNDSTEIGLEFLASTLRKIP